MKYSKQENLYWYMWWAKIVLSLTILPAKNIRRNHVILSGSKFKTFCRVPILLSSGICYLELAASISIGNIDAYGNLTASFDNHIWEPNGRHGVISQKGLYGVWGHTHKQPLVNVKFAECWWRERYRWYRLERVTCWKGNLAANKAHTAANLKATEKIKHKAHWNEG